MAQPKEGSTFVFNGVEDDSGNVSPLGVDANALVPGTVVTVREIVPADEKGAHDNSEDAAVIEWEAPALVRGENGVEVAQVTRAMSIGVEWFADHFKAER